MTEDQYEILKSQSIMLIGEQYSSRVVWLQLFDTSDNFEEDEIRELLIEISQHISSGRVPSGSARKFLDGKLIYYEAPQLEGQQQPRVYAIFTKQVDNIYSLVKKAVEAVATRGGVYSAKRFFNEMIDILENPDKLEIYDKISRDKALQKINEQAIEDMDLNELGLIITHLNQSKDLDFITLEKIYFYIYQTIQDLGESKLKEDDPDEFLDAAYVVGRRYMETDNFHLALELFKHMVPVAHKNERFDLGVACKIQICIIYKDFFPMSGDYIIETLQTIEEDHLKETNNRFLEIYYCLLGYAYADINQTRAAIREYKKAIRFSEQDIKSPAWIAEAYYFLGQIDHQRHYLKDATRYYLTAATISFSTGDLTLADKYRNHAADAEIHIANSIIHSALVHRMEMDHKDAEYRAWESLRLLVKSHQHSKPEDYHKRKEMTDDILHYSRVILKLPGKEKINRDIIIEIEDLLYELQSENFEPGAEQEDIERVSKLIEENIPLPPPTFMLLSVDGRLMTMGTITDDGWKKSDIEGTLLSGILSAIMSMITEVSDEESSLRTVDAGNLQIMIEQTENIVAVLLVDRDIQEFRNRLIRLLNYIDSEMGEELKYWDGGTKIFEKVIERSQNLLAPSIVAANMDEYD